MSEKLGKAVVDALKKCVFSACSIGILRLENESLFRDAFHFGFTDSNEGGTKVKGTTQYDLASLTKPLVTALAVMALVDKGIITPEDEIGQFFPGEKRDIGKIHLSMLLSHSSGLPAHRLYYRMIADLPANERKAAVIRSILNEQLEFQPGSGSLYSDLGYILLGCLVEKLTGISLADYWKTTIAQPLCIQKELFFPGPEGFGSDVCAVTGVCSWTNKRLCGIVHDDNCRMMGGVAGHAGLFGTVSGMLSLLGNLLLQYRGMTKHPAYGNDTLRDFLARRPNSSWTYGFDTPSLGTSSSGHFFSERTVGHLGFTGTSFWVDLDKGIAIVLLTNRVLMGDDPASIRKFRPLVHDIVMSYLLGKKIPD